MTSAVLTTVKGEVLHGGNPEAKLTTLKGEVLHGGDPHAKLTVLKGEVLYANAPANTFRRRCVIVVT